MISCHVTQTYRNYVPSILIKANPKYSLHSPNVVYRRRFDSTPPPSQNASLYSTPPGLYYENDDRLSMSSDIRRGMKQQHTRIFNTFWRKTSRSATCSWPKLKHVRRWIGTKLYQGSNEVIWAKIRLHKLKINVHQVARDKYPGIGGTTHDFYIVLRAPSTLSSSRTTTHYCKEVLDTLCNAWDNCLRPLGLAPCHNCQ
jgi:hypothetical protein